MPFSNYGPHVDPAAPDFVQNLYLGKTPDFVFQSIDPGNKSRRIIAAVNFGGNLLMFGIVGWALADNKVFLEQINAGELWEQIKAEYIDIPNSDEKVFLLIGVVIGSIFVLALLAGMVRDIIKIAKTEKLWYIGTLEGLTVVRGTQSNLIRWNEFQDNIEQKSGPTGDTLTYKFIEGVTPPPVLKTRFKFNTVMESFTGMTIINPPNIMEVKRLSEKRIKENQTKKPDDQGEQTGFSESLKFE